MTEERRRSPLSEQQLDDLSDHLAPKLIQRIREMKHDFWIDPEQHYIAHSKDSRVKEMFDEEDYTTLKGLIRLYNLTTGLFTKFFIGLAVVGAIVLVAIGLITEILKK